MNLLLVALMLMGGQESRAETQLLICEAVVPTYSASLQITEDGTVSLKVRERSQAKSADCRLRIAIFEYKPRAVAPHVTLEFDRQRCSPPLSARAEKEVLRKITLHVDGSNTRAKPETHFQWLRHSQTMPCTLRAFEKQELRRNAELWAAGRWGH